MADYFFISKFAVAVGAALVGLHGWRIWVESSLGKGSKFTFIIPK